MGRLVKSVLKEDREILRKSIPLYICNSRCMRVNIPGGMYVGTRQSEHFLSSHCDSDCAKLYICIFLISSQSYPTVKALLLSSFYQTVEQVRNQAKVTLLVSGKLGVCGSVCVYVYFQYLSLLNP